MPKDKKTAALYSSGGADEGQLSHQSVNSITKKEAKGNLHLEKDPAEKEKALCREGGPTLAMIGMEELMEQNFPAKESVIDNFLYKGAYLFAGAPKIGKSFLVLQMAYAISTGQPLWEYRVHPGAVLYLALEDQYQRLQERIARMFGVDGQGDLMLAVSANQIGQGLEKQMEYFLDRYPHAQLIIIDTLQKVREVVGDRYSYASDYDVISQLKAFADNHNISILIVHHTRKQQSEDSFEMISGTTGLLGCADGAFLMHKEKRTDRRAVLDVVGRDQPDQRLRLLRNEETLTWMLEGADCELWKAPPDPLLEQVAQLVTPEQPVWRGTATELASLLQGDLTPIGVVKRLNSRTNRLYSDYGIRYEISRSHSGRAVIFTLIPDEA